MKLFRLAGVLSVAVLLLRLPAEETFSETEMMKWKIVAMGVYFKGVWKDFFSKQSRAYTVPRITWYTGKIKSACGEFGLDNAFYCYRDNTVYCELNFLLAQKRSTAAALNSPGYYAPIVILAHEWGHAVEYWYTSGKYWQIGVLQHEQVADCLAGVVTRAAERAGKLDRGDIEEAEYALRMGSYFNAAKVATAGILPPQPDGILDMLHKLQTHGESQDRIRAFRKGYRETATACLEDVRTGGYLPK